MIAPLLVLAFAPKLATFLRTDPNTNGVTTTPEGRVFIVHPNAKPGQPRVTERKAGREAPFPSGPENLYKPGDDPAKGFVMINSIRVWNGALWLVDVGASAIGKPALPGGPKLVRVDLENGAVKRTYHLEGGTTPRTNPDDVRFHGGMAVLSDAGDPGLIVLDLESGKARRALHHQTSTTDQKPLRGPDGKALRDPQGKLVKIHADQMEFSPDGANFYFQACDGPMYRMPTRFLKNDVTDVQRARQVQLFAKTATTSGTAIDAKGNVYVGNAEKSRIERYAPDGRMSIVVADPRLVWPDAMWIDSKGGLLIPASQMNRTAGLNGGKERTVFPVSVYRLALGLKPVKS